jgi:beta-aspartyl-dipeptidase (metallo-type)
LLDAGVPDNYITFSSDSCGSLPGFDDHGRLVKLEMGLPSSNLRELADSVIKGKLPLSLQSGPSAKIAHLAIS